MTYIMPEIALATRDDIVGILNLQEQNLLGRGGLLSVRLPGAFIEAALDDLPQIVARRDGFWNAVMMLPMPLPVPADVCKFSSAGFPVA